MTPPTSFCVSPLSHGLALFLRKARLHSSGAGLCGLRKTIGAGESAVILCLMIELNRIGLNEPETQLADVFVRI